MRVPKERRSTDWITLRTAFVSWLAGGIRTSTWLSQCHRSLTCGLGPAHTPSPEAPSCSHLFPMESPCLDSVINHSQDPRGWGPVWLTKPKSDNKYALQRMCGGKTQLSEMVSSVQLPCFISPPGWNVLVTIVVLLGYICVKPVWQDQLAIFYQNLHKTINVANKSGLWCVGWCPKLQ